jgi:hypothetical protein
VGRSSSWDASSAQPPAREAAPGSPWRVADAPFLALTPRDRGRFRDARLHDRRGVADRLRLLDLNVETIVLDVVGQADRGTSCSRRAHLRDLRWISSMKSSASFKVTPSMGEKPHGEVVLWASRHYQMVVTAGASGRTKQAVFLLMSLSCHQQRRSKWES